MPNEVENLKLSVGASKPPVGIVPMHPLLGVARVLEDAGVKYAPFNYMAQPLADALESYDNAELRHRIETTLHGGQVTPESYAALDADSGLPHIYHRIAGLLILASIMIRDGVIPADPGQGRRKRKAVDEAKARALYDAEVKKTQEKQVEHTPFVRKLIEDMLGSGTVLLGHDPVSMRDTADAMMYALRAQAGIVSVEREPEQLELNWGGHPVKVTATDEQLPYGAQMMAIQSDLSQWLPQDTAEVSATFLPIGEPTAAERRKAAVMEMYPSNECQIRGTCCRPTLCRLRPPLDEIAREPEPLPPPPTVDEDNWEDNMPTKVFETRVCDTPGCGCQKEYPDPERNPASGADW